MAQSIEIDRAKRLRDEPHKGHNRWHPDIAPVIEAEPGEEVTLETRDANDLQIGPGTTAKDLEKLERTVAHPGLFQDPKHAMPRNFIATMGMPITADGRNENCDISLAARNAVIHMIQLLEERGWTREQAYVLCSVAVDLRISNVVDVPNVTVSALLPEDIFRG